MQLIDWPNNLGFDYGQAEVWKHKAGFRVFTEVKVLFVPYSVTTNPITAVTICEEQGLNREYLDMLDPREAQELFVATTPTQRELF